MPVILATQEAEIIGSGFNASMGKYFERPYLKLMNHKNWACLVDYGVSPEFKYQYCKQSYIPIWI
jgi:hypothetical protein